MIAEYDVNNSLLRKFVYGPDIDEPICMIDVADSNKVYYYHFDGLGSVAALSNVNGDIVERYSYDVFGEVTMYDINDVGISESSVKNPYFFTGRRYDEETGLYYYRARYYKAEVGRFLQTDPAIAISALPINLFTGVNVLHRSAFGQLIERVFGSIATGEPLQTRAIADFLQMPPFGSGVGLNLYTYVGNNPTSYVDPTGLKSKDPCGDDDPCGGKKGAKAYYKCCFPCMLPVPIFKTGFHFAKGAAKKIGTTVGKTSAKWISGVGWALTAYESIHCIKKCSKCL